MNDRNAARDRSGVRRYDSSGNAKYCLSRCERRKLARAYAAKDWRDQYIYGNYCGAEIRRIDGQYHAELPGVAKLRGTSLEELAQQLNAFGIRLRAKMPRFLCDSHRYIHHSFLRGLREAHLTQAPPGRSRRTLVRLMCPEPPRYEAFKVPEGALVVQGDLDGDMVRGVARVFEGRE